MPDNLTPEQRQKTMRAVKGRDTSLEKVVSSALYARGLRYRRCVTALPGRPDFVFPAARLIVFVDGSFWHGWRFPIWKDKLTDYWRKKIERNRHRDRRNFRKLRQDGWTVLRFWDHQVTRDLERVVDRVAHLVALAKQQRSNGKARSRLATLPASPAKRRSF
jgi:DNA mismatch endonuclease (patch repair protein)